MTLSGGLGNIRKMPETYNDYIDPAWIDLWRKDAEICEKRFRDLSAFSEHVARRFLDLAARFAQFGVVAKVYPVALRDVRLGETLIRVQLHELAFPRWGSIAMNVRTDYTLELVIRRMNPPPISTMDTHHFDTIDATNLEDVLKRNLDFIFNAPR